MDKAETIKQVIEEASWHNYTKKCKYCGKNNTYRMKKTTFVIDWVAINSFLEVVSNTFDGLKVAIEDEHPE